MDSKLQEREKKNSEYFDRHTDVLRLLVIFQLSNVSEMMVAVAIVQCP